MKTSSQSSGSGSAMDGVRDRLRGLGSVLVAYSGGCDSTLLAALAVGALGDKALAVTVVSAFISQEEAERAVGMARQLGIRHRVVEADVLAEVAVRDNPPDRCYHCKRIVFERLLAIAREEGLAAVCDGTQADDQGDYRPGRRALRELGIVSPFEECGVRKADIRAASQALGLPTWDLPAAACLASRVPYGTALTREALHQVEAAEAALARLGFRAFRVRHHGPVARLELAPADLAVALARREELVRAVKTAGFRYVALDLEGYRMGSLNPS